MRGTGRHRRKSKHAGYLGANVCAQNDDRDGSNRCKKILEAANDLEVSRVLLDKALKSLGENPSTDQIRAALGMENMAVSSRPAPWWDSRHDLCLLKGVLEHGPLASEKVREAILEDEALDWPSDMPQAPPKPPAWLAQQAEAPAPAPAPNGDGKKKPAAKKPEKKLPHLPVCCGVRTFYPPASFPRWRPRPHGRACGRSANTPSPRHAVTDSSSTQDRTKLHARHLALVRAATGASAEEPAKKRKAPRPKKEKGPPSEPQPKRQKASASKPTGKPVEVIDVDQPIPKKKTTADSKPKKQATMTSFFGSKKKESENGSKFPGWGQKPAEEETLDDLRAKARARQENTANDEAIARSLEEED